MDKKELLQELAAKMSTGEISREEVMAKFNFTTPKKSEDEKGFKKITHFSVTKMLYVLGAAIVIIGIIIFIGQVWDDIGSFGRIVVTLGLGLLITALGSMLFVKKPGNSIGSVFHFIGGILIPGGAMVTLNEFNVDFTSLWPVTITFGAIFIFYLLLNLAHKHAVLTFFAIANGTAFIYLLVEAIVSGPAHLHEDLYAYLTMIIGVSYLLLAYAFREGWNKVLIGILYFFGTAGFMGAAFSQVSESPAWQIIFFLIVIGGLFLSVYMKSRIILIVSTLWLIVHVSYITGEYFANSIGWPISLVILGFIFIGLGYGSISISKKYIQKS